MKKIIVALLLVIGIGADSMSATRPTARATRGSAGGTTTQGTPQTTSKTTTARAAVGVRGARSATPSNSTAPKTVNRGRAATVSSTNPVVAARAGTTQKVIGSGTKVAAAAKNVIVNEECQKKYEGCMDAFCMLDNDTGGRCLCSDRNSELDTVLAEIEKLDEQSYQMATFGVEKLEMGADAEAAIASANAAAQSVVKKDDDKDKKTTRRSLDMSLWSQDVEFEEEDLFGDKAGNGIEGQEGDALHRAAAEICVAQIPECASDIQMLQMIYSQRIKSDCTAYENSLKQKKTASAQKLAAAEKALRETALEQLRTANKYDLGQCTIEFKKCMQKTGECGEDFSGCAVMSAMDATSTRKSTSKQAKNYQIKGAITNIEISASTYDMLMGKKPLCESVTKSCVAVADQVWDTFLKDIAPQLKNAELIAEDKARQDCIGNISSCFQKACKDNIDPKDPDGSYDMCLTRPETMLNVCKVPLNACGIDASSKEKASESNIWDFVVARLASMRVDACTTEVKECLQSEDRCGKDYTQCIGLDTDTIIRMCPYDKLVGCQKVYGETNIRGDQVYDELANMVQGIMLNIDNSFLTECQNAANEAMIKVCGDTEDCSNLTIDDGIGSRSLDYKICEYTQSGSEYKVDYSTCKPSAENIQDEELGRVVGSKTGELGSVKPFTGVLDGLIYWEEIEFKDDGNLISVDEYLEKIDKNGMTEDEIKRVKTEFGTLQRSIDAVMKSIESDPKVQYCMTGREVQGMATGVDKQGKKTRTKIGEKSEEAARFPQLTKQMRMVVANAALRVAKDAYYKTFDDLSEKMQLDYVTIGQRMAEIAGENQLDARREIAREACVGLAESSTLPRSPAPKGPGLLGKVMGHIVGSVAMVAGGVVAIASTVLMPFTFGLTKAGVNGAMDVLGNFTDFTSSNGNHESVDNRNMTGSKQLNQWNYKEVVTTTFEWETLMCNKCVRSQHCSKTKKPMFGARYCVAWGEEKNTCTDISFK